MRMLPRSARGTWLLSVMAWTGLCAATWHVLPARPRLVLHGVFTPMLFSSDSRMLLAFDADGDGRFSFRFFDTDTGQAAPRAPVFNSLDKLDVGFSADGHWLSIEAFARGTPRVQSLWDSTKGEFAIPSVGGGAENAIFSPTEPIMAWPGFFYQGLPSRVRLVKVPSLEILVELCAAYFPMAFSTDGRLLAAASYDPDSHLPDKVVVWDVATGQVLIDFRVSLVSLRKLEFSPDSRRLFAAVEATHSSDLSLSVASPDVVVWDVPLRRELRRLAGKRLVSANLPHLFITAEPGKIRCYDTETADEMYSVDLEMDDTVQFSVSAAGQWVVAPRYSMSGLDRFLNWVRKMGVPLLGTSTFRPGIRLLDVNTGKQVSEIASVTRHVLSPDGRTLAVSTDSNSTELWDIPPRKPLTWFALAAAVLAPALAGLAWRRSRRLRREVA
jgi:WD40 repeat protein